MPKITEEPLEAIQVRLFKSDLDYMRQSLRGGPVGVNKFIRTAVRTTIRNAKARAAELIDDIEGS